MVHLYKNNGYNMVLDVNSGSIHVVDDVVYDVLELLKQRTDARKKDSGRRLQTRCLPNTERISQQKI